MAVRLRLQRHGRKQRPFYHIVVADQRAPRDGRFIEKIGTYNPMTKPASITLDRDRAFEWLMEGAQPSDTVRAILKFKGVMYRKHLQRGVRKGALTQDAADTLYQEFVAKKDEVILQREETSAKEKAEKLVTLSGTAPTPPPVVEEVVEEAPAEEVKVEETPVEEAKAEETPTEEVKAEETPAEEAKAEETPAEEVKAEETSAEEAKAEETPAEEVKAEETPAEETKEEASKEK